MVFNKFSFPVKYTTGSVKCLIILLILTILSAGCATSHKYKKVKAVPCPCEKENQR